MSPAFLRRALIFAAVSSSLLVVGFFVYAGVRFVRSLDEPPYGSDGPHSGWWASWAGDYDGDGTPDVLLTTCFERRPAGWGACRVVSGRDAATLALHESGPFLEHCESLGDLDGDGRSELAWTSGDALVIDDGVQRVLPVADHGFGPRCVLDDLDGDGARDLLVRRSGNRDEPVDRISAVSSRTGTALWTIERRRGVNAWFAPRRCNVGDVDGDHTADVAVSDENERVEILSGRDGSTIRKVDAACDAILGSLVALGDLDGDGAPEVLVENGSRLSCKVVACDDGEILARPRTPENAWRFFSPGDVDADGRADVAWCGFDAECLRALDGARILGVTGGSLGRGRADYDRDGHDDLLVIRNIFLAEGASAPPDLWRQGKLEIVSGRTHAILKTIDADALALPR